MTKEELTFAVMNGWDRVESGTIDARLTTAIVDEVLKELDKAVLFDDTLFDRIWYVTKHWDLDNGRSIEGTDITGYAGMNGDDVRVIMDAIA